MFIFIREKYNYDLQTHTSLRIVLPIVCLCFAVFFWTKRPVLQKDNCEEMEAKKQLHTA